MSKLRTVYDIKDYFEGPLKAHLEKYFKGVRIFSSITWVDESASAVHVRTSIAPDAVHNPVRITFEQDFTKTGFGYISHNVDISYSGIYEKRVVRKSTTENDLAEQYVQFAAPLIKTCYKIDLEHLKGGYQMKASTQGASGKEFLDQTVQRETDRLKFVARFIKLMPKQNIKESIRNTKSFSNRTDVQQFYKSVLEPYFAENIKQRPDHRLRFTYSPPSESKATVLAQLFIETKQVAVSCSFVENNGRWVLDENDGTFSSEGFPASPNVWVPCEFSGSGSLEEKVFSEFKNQCFKLVDRSLEKIKEKWQKEKSYQSQYQAGPESMKPMFDSLQNLKTSFKTPIKSIKESISSILKEEEEKKSLYVCRKLKNAEELIEWAKAQGFEKTLPADDMHVTIVYSKKKMDWFSVPDGFDFYRNEYDDDRTVEPLGEAVVLKFTSTDLTARWQEFRDAGASWDYPSYMPHISITYDPGDVDLDSIEPYTGLLEFGPEEFTEVESGWADDIEEVSESYDEDEWDGSIRGYESPEDEKWIRASTGFWITHTGDVLPCSYDHDNTDDQMHHNNVAYPHFKDADDEMVAAYNAGWVRVRISDGNFFIEYYSTKVAPKAYRVLLRKIDEFDGSFTLEDYKGAHNNYTDKRLLKVAMSRLNNMSESIIPRRANVQRK